MASEPTGDSQMDEQHGSHAAATAPSAQSSSPGSTQPKTIPSEQPVPSPQVINKSDGETQPVVASSPPPPSSSEVNNNAPNLAAPELRGFEERFRALESKLGLIDTMYGLHKSTVEGIEYSRRFPPGLRGSSDNPDYMEHLGFYRDVLYFMGWVRRSHETLVHAEERNKRLAADMKTKAKSGLIVHLEATKQTCIKAFLAGERAKVMQVDWNGFVFTKGSLDESILTPIEVVSSEPESRTILQLTTSISMRTKRKSTKSHRVERIARTAEAGESSEQEPLPERIKIYSAPLVSMLEQTRKLPRTTAEDSSIVFLRPYQEFIYSEVELRAMLASLEKRYENFDGTEGSLSPPAAIQEGMGGHDLASKAVSEDGVAQENQDDENAEDDDYSVNKIDHEEQTTDENGLLTSVMALLHLRCLIKLMDSEIKPKQNFIRGPKSSHIHFHDLWYLFKPGDEVIGQDEKQVFVVLRVQVPPHKVEDPWDRWNKQDADSSDSEDNDEESSQSPFTLLCAYIDFDGKNFGPVSRKFKISPFSQLKPIRSLPVYPLRFAKGAQTRQRFIDRGRMLLKVAKFKAMYYSGVTIDKRDEIDSQVVVDFTEALADEERRKAWEPRIAPINAAPENYNEECTAICCAGKIIETGSDIDSKMTEDYLRALVPETALRAPSLILSPRSLEDTLSSSSELTETELLVMTYRVFGFVLRSRRWVRLYLNELTAQLDLSMLHYENSSARDLSVSAFDKLELPEGHKEMVKSLVIQHFRSKQSTFARDEQTDLIQGKGKGLIMLLHGAPGVGKTTTAEGIAELFRKPLFQITCGDLGTTAKEVETELERNFALASRWGCVLLLDEADVFLSARERMDFKRNGLVAVFLRILEYYTGILFLTTNRVGDFDEAFASRIHMSLYYPPLDETKTLKVFALNLRLIQQRFENQNRVVTFDESSIEDFARQHFGHQKHNRWNGRQIRNACQTALALAEYDAQGGTLDTDGEIDQRAPVKLELKYFKTVQQAYLDFGRYLGDIQGTEGDRRAIDYKFRARTGTTWQPERNLFSQRGDSSQDMGHYSHQPHDLYRHTYRNSSDMSQSSFGLQRGDPFVQSFSPAAPSPEIQQSRGQVYRQPYPRTDQMSPYQAQQRPRPVGNPGAYDGTPSLGQPESSSHQAQVSSRFSQSQESQQGQQFTAPQEGIQTMRGEEAAHRLGSDHDGSPLPRRMVQEQQPQHTHVISNQGRGYQTHIAPMQETFAYSHRSVAEHERLDYQGDSLAPRY